MCARPTGENGPGLGFRLLLTGRLVQGRQFGLFLGQQALQCLALGLIGFSSQLLAIVRDVELGKRFVHGASLRWTYT